MITQMNGNEFKENHISSREEEKPGHPIMVLKEENSAIENLVKSTILPKIKCYVENKVGPIRVSLIQDINLLLEIDKHYSKKEKILFPYIEEYSILGPPKVMLDLDDEIRDEIKEFKSTLVVGEKISDTLELEANNLSAKISDMISKEEKIMIPKLMDVLTEEQWLKIAEDSDEIGYSIVSPSSKWILSKQQIIP